MAEFLEEWQQRAEAAERTVDVLTKKVLALYAGEGAAAIQKQLARAHERQREARQRRALLEVRTEELARYSASLEAEVAARTRELRTILDHVTSGFLLIDARGSILPGYTRSCHELLGRTTLIGVDVADALAASSARKRAHLSICNEQIFADVLPEEVTLDQVAGRYRVGDRVLQVDARAVRVNGAIACVLLTLTDATALDFAQNEARLNQTLVCLLRQKDAFAGFLEDSRQMLDQTRDAIGAGDQVFAKRAFHTLKGNAAAFGLHDVVALVHDVEERSTHGLDQVDAVEEALRAFVNAHCGVLGIDYDSEGRASFEISEANVAELRELATRADSQAGVERWTAQVVRKPARALLGPLESYVERLAERLGKRARCTLSGMEVLVDATTMRPVFQSLTHLLRNAVDHGLEGAADRGQKVEVGTVSVELDEDATCWHIVVADDGRGIDRQQIMAAARRKGCLTAAATPDDESILGLLFADGFSTMSEVTDISGRGIGMAATRAAVEARGGTVSTESTVGVGTRVVLTIPKPTGRHAPVTDGERLQQPEPTRVRGAPVRETTGRA